MVEGGGNENEKERTNEREVKVYGCSVCLRPPEKEGCFGGGGMRVLLWDRNKCIEEQREDPDWFVRFP